MKSFHFSLQCNRLTHLYTGAEIAFEGNLLITSVAPSLRVLFANKIALEEPLTFPSLERLGCYDAPSPSLRFLVASLPSLSEFHFSTRFAGELAEARRSIGEFLKNIKENGRKVNVFWYGSLL